MTTTLPAYFLFLHKAAVVTFRACMLGLDWAYSTFTVDFLFFTKNNAGPLLLLTLYVLLCNYIELCGFKVKAVDCHQSNRRPKSSMVKPPLLLWLQMETNIVIPFSCLLSGNVSDQEKVKGVFPSQTFVAYCQLTIIKLHRPLIKPSGFCCGKRFPLFLLAI